MIKNFAADVNGERVDGFLAEKTDLSRSFIKKLCDDGELSVNGKIQKGSYKIKIGDEIVFNVPENKGLGLTPVDIPLDIIYQDDDIAVINKPQGLTVHAGNGTKDEPTLVNALLFHLDKLSGINGVNRPGIVHRIDKNTSGLLVVAKNDKAHASLSKQLENKTCRRVYKALLYGTLKEPKGRIETYIDRDPKNRTKMAVSRSGRLAVTNYKVLETFSEYTLCEFSLETGRTHQIRVHAKYLGHPVVGDKEYGYKNCKFNLNGQLLHAGYLEFIHPTTKKRVSFTAPLPDYFEKILEILRNKKLNKE